MYSLIYYATCSGSLKRNIKLELSFFPQINTEHYRVTPVKLSWVSKLEGRTFTKMVLKMKIYSLDSSVDIKHNIFEKFCIVEDQFYKSIILIRLLV